MTVEMDRILRSIGFIDEEQVQDGRRREPARS
jgi:hypothetical protein